MAHILAVDDDRFVLRILEKSLTDAGHDVTTARDGVEALATIKVRPPELIITDRLMPNMDGYELTRRVREQSQLAHIPILVLTATSELKDKLEAFKAGADDYLSKPFESAEMAVRVAALLRRAEAASPQVAKEKRPAQQGYVIAVHSLRGGVGCTSLAVNLAYGLGHLWEKPVLLLDLVLAAGQVSLMLNKPLRRSWADLAGFAEEDFDEDTLANILTHYDQHLHFIAAPAGPTDAERVTTRAISQTRSVFASSYDYLVADLPHNFSEPALDVLDAADLIIIPLAPEMASIKSTSIALDTYAQLGYPSENIRLVLNRTIEHTQLSRKQIEGALQRPIDVELPYAPRSFVDAINRGEPVLSNPRDPVVAFLERLAFDFSRPEDRTRPPQQASKMLTRIARQIKSEKDAGKRRILPFS